jgi:hypothetical protein
VRRPEASTCYRTCSKSIVVVAEADGLTRRPKAKSSDRTVGEIPDLKYSIRLNSENNSHGEKTAN